MGALAVLAAPWEGHCWVAGRRSIPCLHLQRAGDEGCALGCCGWQGPGARVRGLWPLMKSRCLFILWPGILVTSEC